MDRGEDEVAETQLPPGDAAGASPPAAETPKSGGPKHAAPVRRAAGRRAGLHVTGVDLLGPGPTSPETVSGLALDLDDRGLTVTRVDGTTVWSRPWDGLVDLTASQRTQPTSGGKGVVLAVTSRQEPPQRFVVPARRPGSIESKMCSLARRHGVAHDVPDRSLPVLVAVASVLLVATAVAVLLLSAGHVVQVVHR
jgi:hypothetical protein